jgi:uncharacterized alpha-E superfamily protein
MPKIPRSIKASLHALEAALGQLEEADSEVINEADLEEAVKRVEEIAEQAEKDSAAEEEDDSDDEDEDSDLEEG